MAVQPQTTGARGDFDLLGLNPALQLDRTAATDQNPAGNQGVPDAGFAIPSPFRQHQISFHHKAVIVARKRQQHRAFELPILGAGFQALGQ